MEDNKEFIFRDKRQTVNPEVDEGKSASAETGEQTKPSQKKGPLHSPEITFSTFILSLSTSAAMNLGGYTDPAAGAVPQNLELAKQYIDILGMLRDRTKGNLDAEEDRLLETALYELRMRYVESLKTKKGA